MAQTNIMVQPPVLSTNGFTYTVSGVLLPNTSVLTTSASYPVHRSNVHEFEFCELGEHLHGHAAVHLYQLQLHHQPAAVLPLQAGLVAGS